MLTSLLENLKKAVAAASGAEKLKGPAPRSRLGKVGHPPGQISAQLLSCKILANFSMSELRLNLDFERLVAGKLGISSAYGRFLAQAASYCFHLNNHSNPLCLKLSGDKRGSGDFRWEAIDQRDSKTWADSEEATEYGAYGVAIVIAVQMTGIPYVERAAKLGSIDYWLGTGSEDYGVFQRTARLEISGILEGEESDINSRLQLKLRQTERSDETLLAAHAAIIEFSSPEARLVERRIAE
jgi:hypothetical protein